MQSGRKLPLLQKRVPVPTSSIFFAARFVSSLYQGTRLRQFFAAGGGCRLLELPLDISVSLGALPALGPSTIGESSSPLPDANTLVHANAPVQLRSFRSGWSIGEEQEEP